MSPEVISQRLQQLLQQTPFASLGEDMQQLLQARLQTMLTNMNLVTREEFDVQCEVLARTQAKLAELEQRLAALADAPASNTADSDIAASKTPSESTSTPQQPAD